MPQMLRLADIFADAPVDVVGLHTVFEHHDVMQPEALAVFLAEFRVRFPVGVDAPGERGDPIPRTMRAYGLRGTPSTVLIDAAGAIRAEHFGVLDDLVLGASVGALVAELSAARPTVSSRTNDDHVHCGEEGCTPA
jgi:hypothetical protein